MGQTDRGLQDKIRYWKKDIIEAPLMRGGGITDYTICRSLKEKKCLKSRTMKTATSLENTGNKGVLAL